MNYCAVGELPGSAVAWQEVVDQWQPTGIYLDGDLVFYNNAVFEARNRTQNQEPGLSDSPWQEITDQWRSFNIYNTGDIVSYNGFTCRARWHAQGDILGASSVWQQV